MTDLILTGASRGIGQALTLALAEHPGRRLFLVARDRQRLDALAATVTSKGGNAVVLQADLSSVAQARALGEHLAELVSPGATLIHNAGLWPSKRVLTPEGYEASFATNCLAPLTLQHTLMEKKLVRRILVTGAGLMVKGRFDAGRTPTGDDFGIWTYASTKLALAVAMRDVAAHHPEVDVMVIHPGVVRTDLGSRTADRLVIIVGQERLGNA